MRKFSFPVFRSFHAIVSVVIIEAVKQEVEKYSLNRKCCYSKVFSLDFKFLWWIDKKWIKVLEEEIILCCNSSVKWRNRRKKKSWQIFKWNHWELSFQVQKLSQVYEKCIRYKKKVSLFGFFKSQRILYRWKEYSWERLSNQTKEQKQAKMKCKRFRTRFCNNWAFLESQWPTTRDKVEKSS
jgi:hypothetical protein